MTFEERVRRLRIEKHKGKETKEFLEDIVAMAKGEPFEYLVGKKLFCGVEIDLSCRPMIPRDETEFWVNKMIEEEVKTGKETSKKGVCKALDLFSGSGCVGVAILKHREESIVHFVEYDRELKEQIKINVIRNSISIDRAEITIGDIWGGVEGVYDIITAVPPYVPLSMYEEVMEELKGEKPGYFFDKEDGMYYHKKVLENLPKYLAKDGVLYLEFDMTQRKETEQLIVSFGFLYSFLKDPYGHEVVARVRLP